MFGQGQGDPYGGSGGQSGGYGETGSLTFSFTLTGYSWTWDNTEGDPRLWTGKASEPIIQTAEGYGSADDAMTAAKTIGDQNESVMRITVKPSLSGFAGAAFTYLDRWQTAINAPAKEKAAAYEEYIKTRDLVLDGDDEKKTTGGTVSQFIPLIVMGLILVGIAIFLPKVMTKVEVPTIGGK